MFRLPCAMILLLILAPAGGASAGVLVGFRFEDGSREPTTLAGDITSTDFQTGDGLRSIMVADQMIGWGFNSATSTNAIQNQDYWSFTLTAAPGSILELGSIEVKERRFLFGPQMFQWEIEGDALDSTKRTTLFPASNRILDLNVPELHELTSATFRLVAWRAPSESLFGGWMLDDVVVRGETHLVDSRTSPQVHAPEASSIAAWIIVIASVFGMSSLKRRQFFGRLPR